MTTNIHVDIHSWQGDGEAVITTWYVGDGDLVDAGDIIAELMLEKTQIEVEAPVSGLLRIRKFTDEPVRKGDLIATIG